MPGPTVVLVHGAFADASGFAGVIRELESAGSDRVRTPITAHQSGTSPPGAAKPACLPAPAP